METQPTDDSLTAPTLGGIAERIRYIGPDKRCFTAGFANQAGGFFSGAYIDVRDHNAGALARENLCARASEASARTCYDGDLVDKRSIEHLHPSKSSCQGPLSTVPCPKYLIP
jgi:hypothetical protein